MYCAATERQMLPWQTKSILIIENILSQMPQRPYSALLCRVPSSLSNVHHEPKIPVVRPWAAGCGILRTFKSRFPRGKMPAWQMYIFYLFFQFTMIPETTKDPGSICTITSASRVFLICIILPVTFIQSIFCPYPNFTLLSMLKSDPFSRSSSARALFISDSLRSSFSASSSPRCV